LGSTSASVIHFKGILTFEKIGILLNELKNRKVTFDIHPVLYKKLLTLMIEVLENILKYSDHFEDFTAKRPEYLPELELNSTNNGFLLLTRNPVREHSIDVITKRIDKVNDSDEEALKEYYRETITNGIFNEKGGAGLGFIEMAKITVNPLEYKFIPADEGYSIFELKLNINHIDTYHHGESDHSRN
jgi:hypothetical protein